MEPPRTVIVTIPTYDIHDVPSFHEVFARLLGFPDFYGRNMDAWIDCMSSVDDPKDGMSTIHVAKGGIFILDLGDCSSLSQQCPEIFQSLLDCTGFVNHRFKEMGALTLLALAYRNDQPLFR